jgi:hypothetical protein
VKAGDSPFGTPLAKPIAGLNSSNSVRNLEQRSIYLYLPLSVWRLVAEPLATRQPQAIAHGLHEAESVAVAQHAIARIPLASENGIIDIASRETSTDILNPIDV